MFLEWILSAGVPTPQSMASGVLTVPSTDTIHSMYLKAFVAADLPFDLVLGWDWLFFYRQTLPHTSFVLSSGVVFSRSVSQKEPVIKLSSVPLINEQY